eukprot:TRINITY_DN957_c0_g1_i1.p1 TRINITY_DN957_c0_g1~~TRINITY_DN957_c0_g1_i1.p1  ORF type:complete len:1023 (+),score=290.50 TRINITY_DN957_c0_g1_i1:43-3111(+)
MLSTMLRGFLGLSLCAGAAAARGGDLPLRWVLLEVHAEEGVRVVRERGIGVGPPSVDAAAYHTRAEPHHNDMFTLSWGEASAASQYHFKDPRHFHHEHFDEHTDDINGTVVEHQVGYVSVRVPYHLDRAPHIDIVEHAHDGWGVVGPRNAKRHHFTQLDAESARRGYGTLAEDPRFTFEPQFNTVQMVGPVDQTYNIVLLAGCYAQESESKFHDHVARVTKFMKGFTTSEGSIKVGKNKEPLNSQPTNRYFSHFNVFTVWDESPQDGANHPDPNGDVANPKPNRLQCSYGTTVKRMLACNFAEARSLASYAPAADLVLVLVNDEEYGGAGGSGNAYIYTGENFEKVFHHEVGHAAAGLADEYSYGMNENKVIERPNCVYGNGQAPSVSDLPWKNWAETWQANGQDPKPVLGCSWDNYYRPRRGENGDGSCLMKSSSIPKMCEVCREHLVDDGFFKGKGIDLSLPRCPFGTETLIVKENSVAKMHVNPIIQDAYQFGSNAALWGNPFTVNWKCKSAPAGVSCANMTIVGGDTDTTSLTVGMCAIGGGGTPGKAECGWPGTGAAQVGDYEIVAEVSDAVDWSSQQRSTSAVFKMRIVDDAGWNAASCNDDSTHWDCNSRYKRGTDQECNGLEEGACIEKNCHWDKQMLTCTRFFGRGATTGFPETVGYKICTICDADASCNVTYAVKPQPAESFVTGGDGFNMDPVDIHSALQDSLGGSWWALLIGMVGIGVAMLVGMVKTCKGISEDDLSRRHSPCNKRVRMAAMILFALLVWGGVGVTGYGLYQFFQTDTEILDSPLVILTIVGGVLVFFFSIFCFGAVRSRGKCKLGFGVVLNLLMLGFLTYVALATLGLAQSTSGDANYIDQEQDDEAARIDTLGAEQQFIDHLRTAWLKITESNPKVVCSFQSEMRCSGYEKSCFNLPEGTSYCPADCPTGNQYVNPCVQLLQKSLSDNLDTLFIVCISVVSVMGIAFLLVLFLFISEMCCNEGQPPPHHPPRHHDGPAPNNSNPNFGAPGGYQEMVAY